MTSNDRHASHDSPYRTGRHIPLPQSRHAPLTSVATSGAESRVDLGSPYTHDEPALSNGFIGSPKGPMSPNSPYSPGMRSSLSRQATADSEASFDKGLNGEIQMQSFSDGMPPPPPVSHSWKRIERWMEDHYEELFDNICEGATSNDVNELEHELDATLPMDIRESLQLHDGQERGGLPTGVIFGCMLLDCEEIVMEWQNWKKVAEEYLTHKPDFRTPQIPVKAFASSSEPPIAQPQQSGNPLWRQELLARQDSQPPNAVQKAYAHPAWIPLARDWGGNYLAADLAPGPAGQWGQIIIFGRDYDCKYVVARSWGALLAMVADDLGTDKVHIDEDSGELKFWEFKKRQNIEPPYLEILRWRCDQKHGRRPPKRRPTSNGLRVNSNIPPAAGPSSTNSSPYASPVMGPEERGRSPHRLSQKPKGVSPRAHVSSPLARVAEEGPAPIRIHTDLDLKAGAHEKLISVDTPRPSEDFPPVRASMGSDKENTKEKVGPSSLKSPVTDTAELKTVDI
jgi:cell wall assembly regulator SMI1